MSLQVWLPLNGDLRNLGVSNITVTNDGATIDNNGKIGKCYSFNGTNNKIIIDNFSVGNEWSYGCWLYSATSTRGWEGIIILNTNGGDSDMQLGLYTYPTGNRIQNTANGQYNSGISFTYGQWNHFLGTFDGSSLRTYINGVLVNTKAITNGLLSRSKLTIGARCRGSSYDTFFQGKINDVRIYDHCLSAAEVHEIAQGLVLHYKLNQPIGLTDVILNQDTYIVYNNYAGSGTTGTLTNLSETFNGHVVRREVMTPNDTSVNNFKASLGSHGVYGHRQTFLANTKYVFWIYYRPISHMDIRAGGTASNIGGWTEISPVAVGGGWYRVGQYRNGTVTTDKTDNIFTSFYTPTAASGVPITIDWAAPHLLVGTTEIPDDDSFMGNDYIEDNSGYGYHGTITGTIMAENESPRYSSSIYVNGSSYILTQATSFGWYQLDKGTLSCWMKPTASMTGWRGSVGIAADADNNSRGWSLTDYSNIFQVTYGNGSYSLVSSGKTLTQNEWHHCAATIDGTTFKLYFDGELVKTQDITWNSAILNTNARFQVGVDIPGSDEKFIGNYSDVRFYTTVLSDDDILQLYHTGAKIDNKANFHTYEINENGTNKLTKTGIMYDNMVESIKVLPDGSYWQLLLFHYVDGGNNLFTSSNATDCNEFGLYSRLKDINNFTYNNKYEFYVIQDDIEYRWTQTNQPTASAIAGLTTVSGYTNPVNGLAKSSQSNTYIGYNSWWGACGCWTKYSTGGKTGIPGFGSHDANGICTRYLALYARIAKADVKLANQTANTSEFIEL